jgi:choline kinase
LACTLPAQWAQDVGEGDDSPELRSNGHASTRQLELLIDEVSNWLKEQQTKQSKKKRTQPHIVEQANIAQSDGANESHGVRDADDESLFNLGMLESIIKQHSALARHSRSVRNRSPTESRKGSMKKLLRKQSTASSDTDAVDNELMVPSCNAFLDNSKTMSYAGGASEDSDSDSDELRRASSYRDKDSWLRFKFEIVRLTHTLRLKRWRRVPLDMSHAISVQRLSGALTNAVYVVSPPADLPSFREEDTDAVSHPKKPPPKLLLRVYGPQVEHLIDREAELAILRRLAKKRIGPCMLGTFANGRFEEYFYAETLTPKDLRNPDTSRQIAKRMRELHDGIELLDQERDDGPFVWRNWNKWVPRVEKVVTWLDSQVMSLPPGYKPTGSEAWKRRGFICGVPWKQFRSVVEQYRQWLYAQYGSTLQLKDQLVFAHNDTQYGNILRLKPTGESPLLLPQNTHKQLVVIDFEYSSANVAGQEFANHFTEWCYNYHDEKKPHAFHPSRYPTPEEQDRFVRAYVRHRSEFNVSTPRMAPTIPPIHGSDSTESLSRRPTSSISDFILDARTPSIGPTANDEAVRKASEDKDVARLLQETRLWRLANTAQWVTWGIVQAKVPGMPDFSMPAKCESDAQSEEQARGSLDERPEAFQEFVAQQEGNTVPASEDVVEDEFDYLGYSQHRAFFFWADALQLGLVKKEELPSELIEKLKTVPY